MQTLTTTIKRRWLAEIVAGIKKIEYREIKPYWQKRLRQYKAPFQLRMINGMDKKAPEVTVLIKKVDIGFQPDDPDLYEGAVYRLHIAKVLSYKNWNEKIASPYRGVCIEVRGKHVCCREARHRTMHASADGFKWHSLSTKNKS